MRLLEYRQDLIERGYTVIGGDMHYETLDESKCRPIWMSRVERFNGQEKLDGSLAVLAENIRFNWDEAEGTEEAYREKYANVLLGLSNGLEWALIAFQVTVGTVYLDFYNAQTKETCSFSLAAGIAGFHLRFEVPHADGGSCAVYDVEIGSVRSAEENARTVVTEQHDRVRREIKFFYKPTGKEETYIAVTEYADL